MISETRIEVVALESNSAAAMSIRAAAADGRIALVGIVTDFASLLRVVGEQHPNVVLINLTHAPNDVAMAVRSVLAASPESCVVVTGADETPSTIARAVSAGARGFILQPFEPADLANTVRDAHSNLSELRRLQRGDFPATKRGVLIAVYSPKGGVGCTTIATNLSIAIASRTRKRVAVVDLDLQFGDVGVALDLRGANSIVDLATHESDIDASLVNDVFVRHESGVYALLAPENLGAADAVDPVSIARTVEALRDHFAYTICDVWSSLDELSLAVLRSSDHILLVTTPELPSLKNIRRATVASPLLSDERSHIVLNRYPGKAGVSLREVEKNLARPVSATIPSEGVGVTDAINQGISMFDARARVRAGSSYLRLADLLLNGTRAAAAKPAVGAARV